MSEMTATLAELLDAYRESILVNAYNISGPRCSCREEEQQARAAVEARFKELEQRIAMLESVLIELVDADIQEGHWFKGRTMVAMLKARELREELKAGGGGDGSHFNLSPRL